MSFVKAQKSKQKLRLLLEGAAGSGKTYSALVLAKEIGKKIALIDTEKGSASLYADRFNFDTLELTAPFTPESYIQAIKEAEQAGYDVLIIDSISQEWSGVGGCLDLQSQLGGRFQDWAKITPRHNKFVDSIVQANMHVIATARAKSDYDLSKENDKTKVTKVGLKTEQREGLDFEFTIVFRLNENNMATATKDRTSIFKGLDEVITDKTAKSLIKWLNSGVDAVPVSPQSQQGDISDKHRLYKTDKGLETREEIEKAQETTIPEVEAEVVEPITKVQIETIKELMSKHFTDNVVGFNALVAKTLGREVVAIKSISAHEANRVVDSLNKLGAN